jgi:hypothetical protein
VSSTSSGGEHDSTGLRAKHKLITPLSRCASPRNTTRNSRRFRDDTSKKAKRGAFRLPVFAFVTTDFESWCDGLRGGALRRVPFARDAGDVSLVAPRLRSGSSWPAMLPVEWS